MANTPLLDEPTQLHTLIHLGSGASPALSAYTQAAEHIWLVDACPEVQATLNDLAAIQPNVHVSSALVDVEERAATFYRYSLPWASGPHPVSDELLQRYPGIKALNTHEQTTTAIHHLMAEIAVAKQQHNVLVMDLGAQNVPLIHALEQQGWLSAFTYVVVIPAPRTPLRLEELPSGVQAVAIPPSSVANLLPEPSEATVLQRHPLLLETQRLQAALTNAEQRQQETIQQVEALTKANNEATQQAEQHAQALKTEQEKTAQLIEERNQLTQQRDGEWHKGERLTKERDELKHQLEEAHKQREEALHQNHQNFQAKNTAETRVAQLEKELEVAVQQAQQSRQQLYQEQDQRQQLIEQEMLKAEAQLDLIKDILIQGKEF